MMLTMRLGRWAKEAVGRYSQLSASFINPRTLAESDPWCGSDEA
jgi:hypothetical protein